MAQARPSSCSPLHLPTTPDQLWWVSSFALPHLVLGTLIAFASSGCASSSGHTHAHNQAELSGSEAIEGDSEQAEGDDEPPTNHPSASKEEDAEETASDNLAPASDEAPAALEAPEFDVARAALHRIPDGNNHLGLVLAVAVRTADLPWVLALENRSPHDLTLAALPTLIHLDITPSGAVTDASASPPAPQSAATASTRKVECGTNSPTKLGEGETLALPAGAMLVHAFDPSTLCSDSSIFTQGATAQLTYGFPTQTKKVWRKGGSTEEPIAQTAPFLAERLDNGKEPVVGLKHLVSEPVVLGRTYPLSQVTARPASDSPDPNLTDAPATVSAPGQEPPPFRVIIQPLGTSEKPEMGLVNVTLTNTSSRSVLVHLRREYFTYEVTGPSGSLTCQMLPSALSAGTISYTTIAPGASVSVATRLAEACPPQTFGEPGRYTVAVRFSPESVGEERNANAFVGSIEGTRVVTLLVPGPQPSALPYMRVVPVGK